MADLYTQIVNGPVGKQLAGSLGLPVPTPLERFAPGQPLVDGSVLLGGAPGGRLAEAVCEVLALAEVETYTELREDLRTAAADAGLDARVFNPAAPGDQRFKALVFDASAIGAAEELEQLHAFFSPAIRKLRSNGRVVVLGTPPEDAAGPRAAVAQRALEGFTRSLAKEARGASTVQLVYVAPGAEDQVASTLRFLLSPKSAFVDGQVIRVGDGTGDAPAIDWDKPLDGKVALVTGASRGIGAAIASVLARDGAHVVGLDVPALAEDLKAVTDELGGTAIEADVTAPEAPVQLAAELKERFGGVDVVVHNAGITRDKTIAAMKPEQWDQVLQVNLIAPERITAELVDEGVLRPGGRVIGVSSIGGIAGNRGQTNYGASKAGVIGLVDALAPTLAKQQITINAVAPGFIETAMTAAMPVGTREGGRRLSSLSQGGLPVDVAEVIAWFASPASSGVTGNVVRACGQSLIGA